MPFSHSGVADAPCDFESRLVRAMPHLQRLILWVPEKHDLVLIKILRGVEHDLEAIEAIHKRSALDLGVLLTRYQLEMGAVVGDPMRLRGSILKLVERLFPDDLATIEAQLGYGDS